MVMVQLQGMSRDDSIKNVLGLKVPLSSGSKIFQNLDTYGMAHNTKTKTKKKNKSKNISIELIFAW